MSLDRRADSHTDSPRLTSLPPTHREGVSTKIDDSELDAVRRQDTDSLVSRVTVFHASVKPVHPDGKKKRSKAKLCLCCILSCGTKPHGSVLGQLLVDEPDVEPGKPL